LLQIINVGDSINGTVLLTGSNGFLGAQIALRVLNNTDHTLYAMVRARDNEGAKLRLSRAWWDWPELVSAIGHRVIVLAGDVSAYQLGLSDKQYHDVVRIVTHIIHTAADLRLNGPIEQLRKTNVHGTENMLKLAFAAQNDHGIARFTYVSTAYVAGGRTGDIEEESLSDEYGFYSNYEMTKFEAELLVRKAKAQLPVSIFRPSQVVGDSKTGAIKTFNTLYFPLRLYLNRKPRVVPVSPSLKVNMIPVDYVADAITKLTFIPEAEGLTFHLVTPFNKQPTVCDLIEFMRNWTNERFSERIPRPWYLPLPVPLTRGRFRAQGFIEPRNKKTLSALAALIPYFKERRRFKRDNVDRILGTYDFQWQEVFRSILNYAAYMGFLHRSDRTVHEQILHRLKSDSMPISYYDFIDGKIVPRSNRQVRKEMVLATNALNAMGISKGDCIAIMGVNSTSYIVLDVAISMLGAVSVPLYISSPPAEIDLILKETEAKLLLVGVPDIIKRLAGLNLKIPVVSFYRADPVDSSEQEIIGWQEFLNKGEGGEEINTAPVNFDDLVTIRYTSGTTGRVKGVCFTHEKLRWMAEALCSIMESWKARNQEVSYLSYLPMNHVLEGIITAYSPYYTPAPFHIYFLENMKDLQNALRIVRPMTFFSVPRFYEKVWEGIVKSCTGRKYMEATKGLRRIILGKALRTALLNIAGLNRCQRIAVGSAPISMSLLGNFQKLGIEVLNGYGLTEAPLVTMNRIGANRIDTVGEPMPHTEIRIADDGEILVRGPQVAVGYLRNETEDVFRDGWLYTGDTGYLNEKGSLVLQGRKKEMIVTSYGKTVHPGKIESMLRNNRHIDEALIVGEGRPYCSALLWVPHNGDKFKRIDSIGEYIKEMNHQLSHPEQVKRWAILRNGLSIDEGELTASLKLKRQEILLRLSELVEALYSGGSYYHEDLMHIGEAESIE
jgi:long-chain acyl-CoA synthetase